MRVLSTVLFALALLVVLLGVAANVWLQGMGCAFVTSGACTLRWPWEMNAEDVRLFVLPPLGLAVLLALGGWVARRR